MGRERCASSTIRCSWRARIVDAPISHSAAVPAVNLSIGARFGFADPIILPKRVDNNAQTGQVKLLRLGAFATVHEDLNLDAMNHAEDYNPRARSLVCAAYLDY